MNRLLQWKFPAGGKNDEKRCLFVKPKLLGFFKGGRRDFESCVAEAMADLLKTEQVVEEDQPWKVE